jgi:hypothetical protein
VRVAQLDPETVSVRYNVSWTPPAAAWLEALGEAVPGWRVVKVSTLRAVCVCVCVCVSVRAFPVGHACWLAADVLYLYLYLYFYLRACTHIDVYMYAIYSYMHAHEMLHR